MPDNRKLREEIIQMVAEMVVECRKLSKSEFQQWKNEVMRETTAIAKPFIERVIMVVEDSL